MMIDKKERRNILFIGSDFFGYYKAIINAAEELGWTIHFFNDRIRSTTLEKILFRLNRYFLFASSLAYYQKIIKKFKNCSITDVFVIEGQSLTPFLLRKLHQGFPSAKFTYILWDSLSNYPYCSKLVPFFDKVFSFEKKDCEKNKKIIFHPTFFRNEYASREKAQGITTYFASFIGTAWPEKVKFLEPIKRTFDKEGRCCFFYYFLSSKTLFYIYKLRSRCFRPLHSKDVHFTKLSDKQVRDVYHSSYIIVDCPPQGQEGITIRTFEVMAMGKKLITTNEDIVNYDFYNPSNIYVAKNGIIDMSNDFFRTQFVPINESVFQKYSIKNWLSSVLDL